LKLVTLTLDWIAQLNTIHAASQTASIDDLASFMPRLENTLIRALPSAALIMATQLLLE
jgi:hypothetical protein